MSHQLPEWSDYRADFSLLNGRVYPDTLLPHSPIDAITNPPQPYIPVSRDPGGSGDLIIPPTRPDLQYQPMSALITCEPGENVLLRFANPVTNAHYAGRASLPGRCRDATLMRGRDGNDSSYSTNTLSFGAGESFDTIFKAPAHSGGSGPDKYVLYNRTYTRSDNLAGDGLVAGGGGGQRTEVHVYPSGSLLTQRFPNDLGVS